MNIPIREARLAEALAKIRPISEVREKQHPDWLAKELLVEHLTDEQYDTLGGEGRIYVSGPQGWRYKIQCAPYGNGITVYPFIKHGDGWRYGCVMLLTPNGNIAEVPWADKMLALLLALRTQRCPSIVWGHIFTPPILQEPLALPAKH